MYIQHVLKIIHLPLFSHFISILWFITIKLMSRNLVIEFARVYHWIFPIFLGLYCTSIFQYFNCFYLQIRQRQFYRWSKMSWQNWTTNYGNLRLVVPGSYVTIVSLISLLCLAQWLEHWVLQRVQLPIHRPVQLLRFIFMIKKFRTDQFFTIRTRFRISISTEALQDMICFSDWQYICLFQLVIICQKK